MKIKLTKKQQTTIYSLIQKHLAAMNDFENDNHWGTMGSSTHQINELIEILKNGYDSYWKFEDLVNIYGHIYGGNKHDHIDI